MTLQDARKAAQAYREKHPPTYGTYQDTEWYRIQAEVDAAENTTVNNEITALFYRLADQFENHNWTTTRAWHDFIVGRAKALGVLVAMYDNS